MLPKNSVGAKQIKANAVVAQKIKANAVVAKKIKAGAVNGAKVADGSLTGADVAPGSLTGANLAAGTVATANLADAAVNSAKVLDKSLKGGDIAPDSLTGAEIDESTLGPVPNAVEATRLGGKSAAEFLTADVYKKESALAEGINLGDGTYAIEQACDPGDILLSGGPADVNAASSMVESFPAPGSVNGWKVRIRPNPAPDNFLVVVLCLRR